MYFFRNPDRVVPTQKGILVSPADGTVSAIADVAPPAELGMGNGLPFGVDGGTAARSADGAGEAGPDAAVSPDRQLHGGHT